MSQEMVIGIDPGQLGGIVAIHRTYEGMRVWGSTPMPDTEREVWDWIKDGWGRTKPFCVIEKVHAMPGNGVAGMFKFGMGYGGLRMALIAASIPFDAVTPQKWMKELGILPRKKTESKTQFKNRLKKFAEELFPKENITLATSDALLIALYAWRTYG